VSLFDAKIEFLYLSVSNHTDNCTKLGNTVKFVLNILSTILLVLESVLAVSLLLGLVPVLVATTLVLFTQMLRKDGSKSTKTVRGLDVSNNTNNHHGRSFKDRDCIDDFTLVHESTGAVHTTDNMGHARLVAAKGREMRRVGIRIARKGTNAPRMVLGTLLGQEPKGSGARSFKLAMSCIISKRGKDGQYWARVEVYERREKVQPTKWRPLQ
jgi:hypothetical protein